MSGAARGGVALAGATGRTGGRVLARVLDAGRPARVLVRDPARLPGELRERLPADAVVVGDARDPDAARRLVAGADALVSTLGLADTTAPSTELSDALRTLVAALAAAGARRVIAVANTVVLPHPDGGLRADRPLPAWLRHIAAEHVRQYDVLRAAAERDAVAWTLFCPATLTPDRAGRWRTAVDDLPRGAETTGLDDLAEAIVRELDEERFVGKRVGIVSDAG